MLGFAFENAQTSAPTSAPTSAFHERDAAAEVRP